MRIRPSLADLFRPEPSPADQLRIELRQLDARIIDLKRLTERHGDRMAAKVLAETEARRQAVLDELAAATGCISG